MISHPEQQERTDHPLAWPHGLKAAILFKCLAVDAAVGDGSLELITRCLPCIYCLLKQRGEGVLCILQRACVVPSVEKAVQHSGRRPRCLTARRWGAVPLAAVWLVCRSLAASGLTTGLHVTASHMQ